MWHKFLDKCGGFALYGSKFKDRRYSTIWLIALTFIVVILLANYGLEKK
ncbi:MAG TPA: hypothetical protein V6C71_26500 [Coleofasciculaceae cyanobacterium]|jgi:hypothetical protein